MHPAQLALTIPWSKKIRRMIEAGDLGEIQIRKEPTAGLVLYDTD